jgi:membrane fusion protein (multidrug efflux system)
VLAAGDASSISAKIVALDARIDPSTRNALVRARIERAAAAPAPGSSVRVQVPIGFARKAVTVPASALRKGPGGDQVFVVAVGEDGKTRASLRQVQSGTMLEDSVVILTGLTAGEQVAASGSFKLREGALVMIAGKPAPDASVTLQ